MGTTRGFLIVLILCFIAMEQTDSIAQSSNSDNELREKYWNYRERFKKSHIALGVNPGSFLPLFIKYNYGYAASKDPKIAAPACANFNDSLMLEWTDNSLRELSTYIAVLSTEIKLLNLNGEDCSSAFKELYYSLMTLNRLDRLGERYLDPALGQTLDGRYMRDDVQAETASNWQAYDKSALVNSKAYADFNSYRYTNSVSCSPRVYDYKNIMSKDDVVGILWGLAFVKKYVPNQYVTDQNGSNGIYILDEAIAIASRLMTYLTTLQSYNKECGPSTAQIRQNWKIIYPLVNHNGIDNTLTRDELIGNDFFYAISPAIAQLGQYITGISYSHIQETYKTSLGILCSNSTSTIDGSRLYAYIVWGLTIDPSNLLGHTATTLLNPLASIFLGYPGNALVSARLNLEAGLVGPMTTEQANLISTAYKFNVRYDLVISQFRNSSPPKPKPYYENILLSAPACEYVGALVNVNEYNTPYFGRDLFIPGEHGYIGDRSGLDYMLMYNLYQLQYNGSGYSNIACDCHPKGELFNSSTTISQGNTLIKGRTNILSMPFQLSNNISTESYISNNISINSGATLALVEFTALCSKANTSGTTLICNGTLQIGTNSEIGVMRVGQNTQLTANNGSVIEVNENSTLKISKNSYLELKFGSTFRLRTNSKLIIENGGLIDLYGNLEIEPGAIIEIRIGGKLNYRSSTTSILNNNFVVNNKGELNIYDNLNLAGQSKIEADLPPGQFAHINVYNNAEFIISGTNSNSQKIKGPSEGALAVVTHGSSSFVLVNSKTTFGRNFLFFIIGSGYISNCNFESLSPLTSATANGMIIIPKSNTFSLQLSNFSQLAYGVAFVQSNSPATCMSLINQCTFTNNYRGLKIIGKGATITTSNFSNNSIYGLNTEALNAQTTLQNCTFTNSPSNNSIGILNKGASYQGILSIKNTTIINQSTGIQGETGRIIINNCIIESNEIGLRSITGTMESSCSDFTNNLVAISIDQNGKFKTNYGSRNTFSNNSIAFHLTDGTLNLSGGENLLNSNVLNFMGNMKASTAMTNNTLNHSHGSLNYYTLLISRNQFTTSFAPAVNNNVLTGDYGPYPQLTTHAFNLSNSGQISVPDLSDYRHLYPINFTPNFTYTSCPSAGITETPWGHIEELDLSTPPTNIFINNNHYSNIELKEAIIEAASLISMDFENPNNDSLAVLMLASIMNSFDYVSSGENLEYIAICHELMGQAISNSVVLGQIPVDYKKNPLPINASVLDLISSIHSYVDEINSPENAQLIAFKLLEVVQLYRISAHYDDALSILSNDSRLTYLPGDLLHYWSCIIQTERALVHEEIDNDQYLSQISDCSGYLQMRRKLLGIDDILHLINIKKSASNEWIIYPNPVMDKITFKYYQSSMKIASITIYTINGNLISSFPVDEITSDFTIDMSGFAAGIYLLEVENNTGQKNRVKVVKQ